MRGLCSRTVVYLLLFGSGPFYKYTSRLRAGTGTTMQFHKRRHPHKYGKTGNMSVLKMCCALNNKSIKAEFIHLFAANICLSDTSFTKMDNLYP